MAPRGLQNLQHLIHFCVRFFNIPEVKRSLYSLNCSEKKKYNNQYPYTRFSFMRESRNISRVRGGGRGGGDSFQGMILFAMCVRVRCLSPFEYFSIFCIYSVK